MELAKLTLLQAKKGLENKEFSSLELTEACIKNAEKNKRLNAFITETFDYARDRAKSMLKSNHNRIGKIRSAKMGVFQITPVDSNDVSDSGFNDLSSIEKKVTAVANITFAIK